MQPMNLPFFLKQAIGRYFWPRSHPADLKRLVLRHAVVLFIYLEHSSKPLLPGTESLSPLWAVMCITKAPKILSFCQTNKNSSSLCSCVFLLC